MTKEKTLSNANSVGPKTQASLAGMTKEKTSGNNRNELERKTRLARLAGMTKEENSGNADKTESRRSAFAYSMDRKSS